MKALAALVPPLLVSTALAPPQPLRTLPVPTLPVPTALVRSALDPAPDATAQDLAIALRLSADPTRRGPTAWTWLREALVPESAGWPAEGDPFAPLTMRWRAGRFDCTPDAPDAPGAPDALDAPRLSNAYASATVDLDGVRVATAECAWSGHETWRCTTSPWCPPRVRSLFDLLGLDLPGAQALDVAVLAGHLVRTPAHDGGPLADLLTRGAVEIGELRFAIQHRTDQVVVRGTSAGGLVLPFAIVLLAMIDGDADALGDIGDLGNPQPTRSADERRRWMLLALAARDDARTEATAQLARLRSDDSADLLERLLWSDDTTRANAMEGLVRANRSDSLPAVVRAASAEHATTPELAHAALVNLWNSASSDQRNHARLAAGVFGAKRGWFTRAEPAPEADAFDLRGFLLGALVAAAIATLVWHERLRRVS